MGGGLGVARFESILKSVAAQRGSRSESVELAELRKAARRLMRQPGLRAVGAGGQFSYEDRTLALAAAHARILSKNVGTAGEAISDDQILKWLVLALRAAAHRSFSDFSDLYAMTPDESIASPKDVLRIALIGDAGFLSEPQSTALSLIKDVHGRHPFDFLIHLGDTYFGGDAAEFMQSLLAPLQSVGPKVLLLCGNHDLYFGQTGFLNALKILRQPGRYFEIVSPGWRMVGLDTALGAKGVYRRNAGLDRRQSDWLADRLAANDGRRVVLMSHHPVVSAWEKPAPALRSQLRPRLTRKVTSWYWGHEHRAATYESERLVGACVGNGAFLEKWSPPSRSAKEPTFEKPKWYPKAGCRCIDGGGDLWPHGFLELELRPDRLLETFHVEGQTSRRRVIKGAPLPA